MTRGITNSRLKDFYDLWLIASTFTLEQPSLAEAVKRTFERRGTPLPSAPSVGLTDAYAIAWAPQWRTFLGRERLAVVPDDLTAVLNDLRKFLMPIVQVASME